MKFVTSTILFLFISANLYAQNRFPYSVKNEWFYVDSMMQKISDKTYSFIFPFQGGYAVVKQKNKYGVINTNEKIIISMQYDTIVFNSIPPFYCIKNNEKIWLDINEKKVNVEGHCGQSSIGRAFWIYRKNNKIGLLKFNTQPQLTDSLPNIYDELHEYFSGIALVRIGKKWGTINSTGKTITKASLDSVQIVNNYTDFDIHKPIKYYYKNKVGFINTNGIVITKPKFKDFYFTIRQFTLVRTANNKLVYIDSKGREYYK